MTDSSSGDVTLSGDTAVSELKIHVVDGQMFVAYREYADRVQPTRLELANAFSQMSERMTDIANKVNQEDRH